MERGREGGMNGGREGGREGERERGMVGGREGGRVGWGGERKGGRDIKGGGERETDGEEGVYFSMRQLMTPLAQFVQWTADLAQRVRGGREDGR